MLQGIPTIPSTLQEELDTNPFLRPSDPAIRKSLGTLTELATLKGMRLFRWIEKNVMSCQSAYMTTWWHLGHELSALLGTAVNSMFGRPHGFSLSCSKLNLHSYVLLE